MRGSFSTLALIALLAVPALARPGERVGDWDGGGFGVGLGTRFGDRFRADSSSRDEGKVAVATLVAAGASASSLGRGAISIAAPAQGERLAATRSRATYEAALLSALAGRGYDTAVSGAAPQTVELTVSQDVAVPAEIKGSPVHGAAQTTISNRGSGFGVALGIDLSKPRKALLTTQLQARIRDRASQQVLWEGRADILTRDGSGKWTEQAIATKLADALFAKFPQPTG